MKTCSEIREYFQQRAGRNVVKLLFTQNSCRPIDRDWVPDGCLHCCGLSQLQLPRPQCARLALAVEEEVERKSWSSPLGMAAVAEMQNAGLVVVCEELARCERVKWEWVKW